MLVYFIKYKEVCQLFFCRFKKFFNLFCNFFKNKDFLSIFAIFLFLKFRLAPRFLFFIINK